MQDIIDQVLGYLKGIWSKRWWGMLVAWIICLVGWGGVYKLPDKFESHATIYIDTESLLKPLLAGLTVQTDVGREIQLMVRTLLTRPNVEKIIRLSDLDLSVKNDIEYDELVVDLQNEIRFKKASRSKNSNLYKLSYKSIRPETAQLVLQSVITVFVENSIGQSKEDTISAKTFIDKQIAEYEKRLSIAEDNLKVFKQKNVGLLPSAAGGYYNKMDAAKAQLEQTKLELNESERQQVAMKGELEQLLGALKNAAQNKNNNLLSTVYDARIEKLNADLDEMLLVYTDNHPDVKAVIRVLSELKKKQEEEIKKIRSASVVGGNALESNPVYQELQINLGAINSRVVSLRVRLREYQRRYEELVQMIDHIPEVEARLSALNRDYAITKGKYEDLLNRRESANISESIDKTTDSVQFNVLEQPRVESKPVGPNRILFSSAVLAAALGGGIGFAFLLAQLKPVFNSARETEKITELPVWGAVSAVTSPGQRRRRMLMVMTYLSLLFLLFTLYAMVIAWYLDLANIILEKVQALMVFF